MDVIDANILKVMKENGRATASEISRLVNLSVPAVAERIRKLEQGGVIEKYTVKISKAHIQYNLAAFILVNLDRTESVENFRKQVVLLPSVLECHHVAGQYDYLLKVLVRNTQELEDFLSNQLKKIGGVASSNTIIVLSTLKEEMNL